jgi:dipeptidyl aminopeptidase/acylaminoacyl peptidase
VPDGITGKAPVILDLKGVSWDFFPLVLNDIKSPKILGSDQNRFIYIVPSFRGEILKFNNQDFVSEGDRTDSWDGAADDALALLNAALTMTPEADAERVGAYGKSRGGSVALLAGIRNPKIRQVLDWAGPADWFELMATEGWTQKEIAADALLNKSAPNEDGGQFVERFLLKAVEGKWNLRDVRFKMIADSPIYFVKKLPRWQAHYGIEDEMVPLVNGQALVRKMKINGRPSPDFTAFFHKDSGHDLNQDISFTESKKFLMALLAGGKPE